MKSHHHRVVGILTVIVFMLVAGGTAFVLANKIQQSRPSASLAESWNSQAIQTAFAGFRVEQIDSSSAAVVFLYDLNNRSSDDYQITNGPPVVVMRRLKPYGTLSSERAVALTASAFLPAKNRSRISLRVTEPFSWPARMDTSAENHFRGLVAEEVADLEGFVIFDESHRLEIDLPGSWPAGKATPASP